MPVILLTNHYDESVYKILKSAVPSGFSIVMLESTSQDELIDKARVADYFLVSGRLKINKEVIDAATKLKMIQRTGVGLDSLDLKLISERKIPLYVNSGVNARSVAEHTVLLMLSALRRFPLAYQNTKNGIWKKQVFGTGTHELFNKKLGLIGMGSIGKLTAELLKPFGTEILYYDVSHLGKDDEKRLGVSFCDLEELVSSSDIVSLHCPLTENTRHLLDKEMLSKFKEGAVIVNTARGGLIDETALLEYLENGKISCAALDVFEKEPLPKDSPLITADNIIMTSHIGGVTYESFYRMMNDAMKNIECFENGDLQMIGSKKVEL